MASKLTYTKREYDQQFSNMNYWWRRAIKAETLLEKIIRDRNKAIKDNKPLPELNDYLSEINSVLEQRRGI